MGTRPLEARLCSRRARVGCVSVVSGVFGAAASMNRRLEGLVRDALSAAVRCGELPARATVTVELEEPAHPMYGDVTTRVAMVIAERTGRPAPVIADTLLRHLADPHGWLDAVGAAGPGFVNL